MVSEGSDNNRKRYLVGGLPRSQVNLVGTAFEHTGSEIGVMQLSPICAFNAFELAYSDIFNNQAFFLVDIGHTSSTVMVGEMRRVRSRLLDSSKPNRRVNQKLSKNFHA